MLNLAVVLIIFIISFFINNYIGDASAFFVLCMTILCFVNLVKMKIPKNLKIFLIVSFIIRIALVVVDLYYYRLPDAGSDDDGFYRVAMMMKEGSLPMSINIHGGLYSIIIRLLSYVIGENRFGLQFMNVIFFCVSIIYLNKTLDLIGCNNKTKKIVLFLISFAPYIMFSNSILRRDTLISTLLIISLYHLINWYKNRKKHSVVISMVCVIFSSLLHTASIFVLPFYLVFYLFYNKKKNQCKFFGINTFKQIVFLLIVVTFSSYFFTNFSTKISNFDSMDSIYNTINTTSNNAGSVYLTNLSVNSILQLIMYTPIKVLYFLFSPMPWNWRGVIDIAAFIFDSLIYIYLIFSVIKYKKNNDLSIIKMLILAFLVFTIVFSLGTFTSGTAIRHRYNILPYLLVLYAFKDSNDIKKELLQNG